MSYRLPAPSHAAGIIEDGTMKSFRRATLAIAIGTALYGLYPLAQAQPFTWTTVVNNGVLAPACGDGTGARKFNSYSQPSVNEYGLVAFRGRSKGSDGGGGEGDEVTAPEVGAVPDAETGPPARGVYVRDMRLLTSVEAVACVSGTVPQPNNLVAPFNEFPAFPRMDASSPAIATRGQSRPVWEYQLGIDPVTGEPTTTRVGTSGVYTNPGGVLTTGASLLGAVANYPSMTLAFSQYSVPGAPAGTRFDQFPGAPAVAAGTIIGFKGNFTVDDIGRTGVFFRDASSFANMTYLVANSFTLIPNQPTGGTTMFGSTAPPSVAFSNDGFGYMYFVGLDNEDAPRLGGIYRAKMKAKESQKLETLVGIGTQVSGEASGRGFNRLGEALSVSVDANFVTFWGAWGTEYFAKTLFCPQDGNADLIAYCNETYPAGFTVNIPVHQGIFVYDVKKKQIFPIAKTGQDGFEDFLYWVYSGAPPGGGGSHDGDEEEEDESREPPRWRSSAFAGVSLTAKKAYAVAFKATQGDGLISTPDGVAGIFLRRGTAPLVTVAKIGTSGQAIDPMAPTSSIVTALGIERDGFRAANLAITAAMLYESNEESIGWAGIYLTQVPLPN